MALEELPIGVVPPPPADESPSGLLQMPTPGDDAAADTTPTKPLTIEEKLSQGRGAAAAPSPAPARRRIAVPPDVTAHDGRSMSSRTFVRTSIVAVRQSLAHAASINRHAVQNNRRAAKLAICVAVVMVVLLLGNALLMAAVILLTRNMHVRGADHVLISDSDRPIPHPRLWTQA